MLAARRRCFGENEPDAETREGGAAVIDARLGAEVELALGAERAEELGGLGPRRTGPRLPALAQQAHLEGLALQAVHQRHRSDLIGFR